MKIYFIILIPFIVVIAEVNAQELKILETVHLNNGSRISGFIIEQIPGGNYTIESSDGNIFVFPESDVEKITREVVTIYPYMPLNYKPNYREIGLTVGTPQVLSFLVGFNNRNFHTHIGVGLAFDEGVGFQFNASYILGQERSYRHYLGLMGSYTLVNDSEYDDTEFIEKEYFFLGPVYSISWLSIMLEVGLGYGCINKDCGITPQLQFGLQRRFNKIK